MSSRFKLSIVKALIFTSPLIAFGCLVDNDKEADAEENEGSQTSISSSSNSSSSSNISLGIVSSMTEVSSESISSSLISSSMNNSSTISSSTISSSTISSSTSSEALDNEDALLRYSDPEVKNIFNNSCVRCHGASNGTAGVSLTTYDNIFRHIDKIKSEVVIDQTMPKFGPLPSDQIQIISEWIAQGALE